MIFSNSSMSENEFETRQRESIIFLLKPKASITYLEEDATIRQGLEKLKHYGYTAIPVIAKDGTYSGTVSEGDFLWHIINTEEPDIRQQEGYQIRNLIRKNWNAPVTIETTLDELVPRIMDQNFVPVIDDRGYFMGIITRRDVINHYYQLAHK